MLIKDLPSTQLFQDMLPYFAIQYDAATKGTPGRKRPRIEIKPLPPLLIPRVLTCCCECPACGKTMHPFRRRSGKGDSRGGRPEPIYFAAGCQHLPTKAQLRAWRALAAEQSATEGELRSALNEVNASCNSCCKGKKCTEAYRAFGKAIEDAL